MKSIVVVLNWNRPSDTLDCLGSLASSAATDFGVVVVDNGSSDDSICRLLEWQGRGSQLGQSASRITQDGEIFERWTDSGNCRYVALVTLPENRGYSAGNNVGIRVARALAAKYVWILNNDTIVEQTALSFLESRADAIDRLGSLGSVIVEDSNPDRVQCFGGGSFSPWTTANKYIGKGTARHDVVGASLEGPNDYVSGASMFCSVAALSEVGDLCEQYFLFYEELDLCRRLRRASFEIGVEPRSVVRHKGGTASGASSRIDEKSRLSAYHAARSVIIFFKRNHPRRLLVAYAVRLVYSSFLMLRRPRLGGAALRGLIDGMRSGPSQPVSSGTPTGQYRAAPE